MGASFRLVRFTRCDIDHQLRKLVRIARALGLLLCHTLNMASRRLDRHPVIFAG